MIDQITILRALAAGLPAAESHPDPPLASFPLRIDWERTQPAAGREPWPEPELRARITTDYPRPVASLVATFAKRGWTAVVTEARGCLPSVGQRPSRQRTNYAVRMAHGGCRAVAIYTEGPEEGSAWGWDAMYQWVNGTFPHGYATVTEFVDGLLGAVYGPSLADAGLGPMLGPAPEKSRKLYGWKR